MHYLLYGFLKLIALPPGLVAVPGLFGVLLSLRWRRLGLSVVAASISLLWLISTPWFAGFLSERLEAEYSPLTATMAKAAGAEAIVVLGGGSYRGGPEFNDYDEVSRLTLERLRYAARLQRLTQLPLAVSGGAPQGRPTSEALGMRVTLESDFKVPVTWAEMTSANTAENAANSRALLPYTKIILVTHAMHMKRAVRLFRAVGFEVVAAPLGFYSRPGARITLGDALPDIKAFIATHYAIYEHVGMLWYDCCYAR